MRIDDLYATATEPVFSFEFFPPKTEEGERNFWNALGELRALEPAFVSVTYGAGGSTKDKTLEIVTRIRGVRHRGDGALHVRQRDGRAAARAARRHARR